jgi:hypothetical protein
MARLADPSSSPSSVKKVTALALFDEFRPRPFADAQ